MTLLKYPYYFFVELFLAMVSALPLPLATSDNEVDDSYPDIAQNASHPDTARKEAQPSENELSTVVIGVIAIVVSAAVPIGIYIFKAWKSSRNSSQLQDEEQIEVEEVPLVQSQEEERESVDRDSSPLSASVLELGEG